MNINLQPLAYTFLDKPLLIGGKAMEFYNLRQSGADIGVCVGEFEIWNSIMLFDYAFPGEHSIELKNRRVASLDKLPPADAYQELAALK